MAFFDLLEDFMKTQASGPTLGLHLTPLARPQNWCVFHARPVPSLVSLHTPASGAGEAQRWAALNPKSHAELPIQELINML